MSNLTPTTKSHKLFLGITCILAATPVIRLGDIQLLEVFFFLHLLWLTLQLILRNFRFPLNRVAKTLTVSYLIFFVLTLLLALASLRFRFYPPPSADTFLKQPFILSLARTAEIALGVFHMIYIASILRTNQEERRYALRFYFWAGVATSGFALLSIPGYLAAGLDWGVYAPGMRARGLFNEGGPFGTYLVTIVIAGLLLHRIGDLPKFRLLFASSMLIPVFLLTQSKAAIIACLLLFLLNVFVTGTVRFKISLLALGGIFAAGIATFTSFTRDVAGYISSYLLIQQVGAMIDQSVYGGFGGRVAGAMLVPRMVLAHPITGIGLGNYPLLFNDPHYLQGLPATNVWEAPGIGIVGYIADFGIPLFLYLAVLLCVPTWMAYRRRSLPIVLVFAAVQPLTHLFGTQLNFYYPWICSGLAISFLDLVRVSEHSTRGTNVQSLRL